MKLIYPFLSISCSHLFLSAKPQKKTLFFHYITRLIDLMAVCESASKHQSNLALTSKRARTNLSKHRIHSYNQNIYVCTFSQYKFAYCLQNRSSSTEYIVNCKYVIALHNIGISDRSIGQIRIFVMEPKKK